MFIPDFDQNKCFPRLPEKCRSAIAPRLCIALFKIADKSKKGLGIFHLSTSVDNFVRNSMANFADFPVI